MDFLTLVILDVHKLNDAADHAGRVGSQIFIGYNKGLDVVRLEPLPPIEVLPLKKTEALRDQIPVVIQILGIRVRPGDPSTGLGRLGHRDGLRHLILTLNINVGNRRQQIQQLREFADRLLKIERMRLDAEDAILRGPARE